LNPINIPNTDACFEREKRGAGEEERDSLLGEIRNLVAPANDFIVLGRAQLLCQPRLSDFPCPAI